MTLTAEQRLLLTDAAKKSNGCYRLDDFDGLNAAIRTALAEIDALRDENMELKGVLGKLPLTADGVPVVPGVDPVWIIPADNKWEYATPPLIVMNDDPLKAVTWHTAPNGIYATFRDYDDEHLWRGVCYSTKAAAKRAAKGGEDDSRTTQER